MNIKNKLKLISTYKFQNEYYSKRAYVRERYDIEKKVLENNIITEAIRNESDLKVEVEILKIINNTYASFGRNIKFQGFSAGMTDSTIYKPKFINDDYSETILTNGYAGIYNGVDGYGLYAPDTFYNSDKVLINNFVTNIALNNQVKIIKLLDTMSENSNITTVVNNYINFIKDVTSLIYDNVSTIKIYYTSDNSFNPNGLVTDVNHFKRAFDLFNKFLLRNVTKLNNAIYTPKIPVISNNISTTDIYNENNLTIEFTNLGFDLIQQDFNNFLYDTKSNPSPDGKSLVKIPKVNSFIFATPVKSTSYFVNVASEYDEVNLTIDNNMAMRIKDFLVNIKTDEAHLNTGKNENQGINLERTILTTGLIESIHLESNINNNYIDLSDKNININGSNGKIAIGLIGENDNISTPYDSDIKRLQAELINLKFIYDRLSQLLVDTGINYTVLKTNAIYFYNLGTLLQSINTKIDDYTLTSITNYSDFRTISDDVFKESKGLKKVVLNESWDKRKTGSDWDKPNLDNYNESIVNISNLSNPYIADLIAQTTVGATIPMRSTRKTEYTDFNRNTKNNLYSSFFNYLSELGENDYLNKCKELVNANTYYSEFQKEREQSVNYCSPQEGATIVALFFTVEYIMMNSALNNLLILQSEYKLNNINSYKLSLGSILKELINTVKGSILSYTSVNPNTPPYILQTTGAEQTFDSNVQNLITNIDNLLL